MQTHNFNFCFMVSVILLAAGLSRRMGSQNKLLLPIRGKPMVRWVAEALCELAEASVMVVLGHEADRVRESLQGLELDFVENTSFESGMTTSIQCGVAASPENTTGFMICLSDLPNLTTVEYEQLLQAFLKQQIVDEACIGLPVYQGRKGNPVIFSASYRAAILAHTEMEGCKQIVKDHTENLHLIEMNSPNCLHDIDTPAAYEELQ